MECLKKHLKEFKSLTLKLIEAINKEDYDALDKLIKTRQTIIEEIDNIKFKKEEIQNLSKELEIIKFDKKFGRLMDLKRDEYKIEMQKYELKRNANTIYNKDIYRGSSIFSKKI